MKKIYLPFLSILLISFSLYGQITVDGNPSDWAGTAPTTGHNTAYSSGEFIYKGVSNDERTDYNSSQPSSDNDIIEFRTGTDGTWLYILIKMRDITNVDYPHVCLVFTNGTSNQNFIGDDSKKNNSNNSVSTPLGNATQYGRLVDLHTTTSGNPTIEMYDGGSWYAPPTSGWQVAFSTTNDAIEAKIALGDLGLTSSSETKISLMTAPNRIGWNNDIDATAWNTEDQTNGVDVMTPGASSGSNAWDRDLNDGNVGYYVSVNLSSAPLPVEIIRFTAQVIKSELVILNWSTATEINNFGFEVERTVKGFNGSLSRWEKIGFMQGAGNSNSPREYVFVDDKVLPGKYAYRLKQIDNDGSFKYSDEIEVVVGNIPTEYEIRNYPNPFNPTTTIQFSIVKPGNYKINLYSITGEKVREIVNEYYEAGVYRVMFNSTGLASGVYISILEGEGVFVKNKMVILK